MYGMCTMPCFQTVCIVLSFAQVRLSSSSSCMDVQMCLYVCVFSIPGWGIAGLMLASHETYYGFLAQHFESCLVCLKTIYECGVVQNLE